MQQNDSQDAVEAPMRAKHFAKVAVALPIAAIVLALLQAQWNDAQGQKWNFPMQGYDPRDILRGKYLNVRFEFSLEPQTCETAECCVCFKDVAFEQSPPLVRPVACGQAKTECQTWLYLDALRSNYRYFVPEDKSQELEQRVIDAIRDEGARVEFVLDQRRRPQITALTIDGTPI